MPPCQGLGGHQEHAFLKIVEHLLEIDAIAVHEETLSRIERRVDHAYDLPGLMPPRLPHRHGRAIAFPTSFGTAAESANSKPDAYASLRILTIFSKLIFSTVSVTW